MHHPADWFILSNLDPFFILMHVTWKKYISLRLTVTCAETSAATSDVLGNKDNKVRRSEIYFLTSDVH